MRIVSDIYTRRLHVAKYHRPLVANRRTLAISLRSNLLKYRDRVPCKLLNEDVTGTVGLMIRAWVRVPPFGASMTGENDNAARRVGKSEKSRIRERGAKASENCGTVGGGC